MSNDIFSPEAWASAPEEISTAELDRQVEMLQALRKIYEKHKSAAKEANDAYEKQKNLVLELLDKAGKTKYFVEDLGTVNIVNKYMVRLPKDLSAKRDLFQWIKEKHGEDTLDGMVSIHSSTLNSFVNELKEIDASIEIPGLEPPTHERVIRFTPKK